MLTRHKEGTQEFLEFETKSHTRVFARFAKQSESVRLSFAPDFPTPSFYFGETDLTQFIDFLTELRTELTQTQETPQ